MLRKRLSSIPVLLTVLCLSAYANAPQDSILFRGEVEKDFVDAMKSFTTQKFDTAAAQFTRILREYPRSHRTTGCYIMGSKALYRVGNYRESIRLLRDLMDLYPESQYVDDAHYTLGLDYYRLGRSEDAAQEFLTARQTAKALMLIDRSGKMLELVAGQLSVAQLQLLSPEATLDVTKALLTYTIGVKVLQTGDAKSAEEILRPIVSMSSQIKYVAQAVQLLDKMKKGGVLKVGVALPLMLTAGGGGSKPGLELLDGIQSAVDRYNVDGLPKVNLEVRDTQGDPGVAARIVADLCSDERVAAIIGPMTSEDVFAAAGVANAKSVPLLTPTATRNGIAGIGPFIFQANPDFETRGRAIARYAFEKRGARKFAVLASQGAVGEPLANAFIDEVKKLGGEMLDVEWYFPGTNDMRPQLLTMRKRVLQKVEVTIVDFAASMKQAALKRIERWGVPYQVLDSLVERGASAPVEFLFGKDGKHIADSLGVPTVVIPVNSDSLAIPVSNVDAMFVPIASSDEIGTVTSQIKYYNFQTLLLGTEDWNELSDLDENRQYSAGAVFTTDTYTDSQTDAYKAFDQAFQKTHNKKATKNVLIGYDAMSLLLQAVKNGATFRNEIAAALPTIHGYRGLHSTISFSPNRVNSFLTVLQFNNRTISRIGEIDLSEPPVIQATTPQ